MSVLRASTRACVNPVSARTIRDGSSRLMSGSASSEKREKAGYKCSKCGQPKRKHLCTYRPGMPIPPGLGGGMDDKARVSWSKHEDETIRDAVGRLGPKWSVISAELPGRTEHAVRNRWHRLQTQDAQDAQVGGGGGSYFGEEELGMEDGAGSMGAAHRAEQPDEIFGDYDPQDFAAAYAGMPRGSLGHGMQGYSGSHPLPSSHLHHTGVPTVGGCASPREPSSEM